MENKDERKKPASASFGEEPEECIILKKGEILRNGISINKIKKAEPDNKGLSRKTCTKLNRGGEGDEDI